MEQLGHSHDFTLVEASFELSDAVGALNSSELWA
jgi:hypothetical protein